MPIHDWTRVPAGLFHDFHQSWVIAIAQVLNGGLLPKELCALIEVPEPPPSEPESDESHYARKGNRLSIRRGLVDVVSNLHVVSPGDKQERRAKFRETMAKYLDSKIHILVIDLFPPAEILEGAIDGPFLTSLGRDRAIASYRCSEPSEVYVEPVSVGDIMPDMPLFIAKDTHVPVPLEATYMTTWKVSPKPLRDLLEG